MSIEAKLMLSAGSNEARVVPKSWFETWRSTDKFYGKTNECMDQFEPDVILGMTGVQHLFDAYVAGLFARMWNDHSPCEVRLGEGSFPDAHLRSAGKVLDLEVTMADKKDRRMADEHLRTRRARERGGVSARHVDWQQEHEGALEAVPRVCREKVRKYLGSAQSDRTVEANLLIYFNFSTCSDPALTDDEMVKLTGPWRHNFQSIWLIAFARAFRAWPSRRTLSAGLLPTI